jgi:multiple sugar transport system substrate-binding protein
MKFKKIVSMLLVFVLAFPFFGFSSKTTSVVKAEAQKTIKVSIMGDGSNKDKMQSYFDQFTKENPSIKVELLYIPVNSGSSWNDYFTKIQTMVAGGNAPDIAMVAIEGIQMFKKMGLAKPLDEYIKKYPQYVAGATTDINQKLQKPFIIDGKNYGLVTEWNNVVMHFNTDLLKDAGLTIPPEKWNKALFLDYCKKLTKTVNGKKQYAFAIPNYYFGAEAWLYNNKASILNDDMTKCTLNSPNAVEVFQLWQDLIYKYKYSPYPEPGTDAIQQLMQGQVAMLSMGRWPTQNYVDNNFKTVAVQYLPTLKTNQVIFGSAAFCVLSASKNPDEAARVSLWTAGKYFTKSYEGAGAIPTRKSVADDVIPKLGIPENYQVYYKSADLARAVQSPPQYPAIASVFDKYLSAVLSNQMKAKAAMDKATIEINAILAKK